MQLVWITNNKDSYQEILIIELKEEFSLEFCS